MHSIQPVGCSVRVQRTKQYQMDAAAATVWVHKGGAGAHTIKFIESDIYTHLLLFSRINIMYFINSSLVTLEILHIYDITHFPCVFSWLFSLQPIISFLKDIFEKSIMFAHYENIVRQPQSMAPLFLFQTCFLVCKYDLDNKMLKR